MSDSARIAEECPAVADRLREYSPELVFWLNGEKVVIDDPDPSVLLADYLRGDRPDRHQGRLRPGGLRRLHGHALAADAANGDRCTGRSTPACGRSAAVDGMLVTTVEGIGNVHDGLDPVQHRIATTTARSAASARPAS